MKLKDGTRIFVDAAFRDGDKPAVVFIHGDGQNHTVWTSVMDYFFQKGHSVLCYDLPGHGLSQPYKDKKYSFSKFVSTLDEILTAHGIREPLIVGNSTGGMIALKYATENDVAGVVAISSCDESPTKHNPYVKEIIKKYISESKKLFQRQKNFHYDKKLLDESDIMLAALKYTSPEAIEGNLKALKKFDIRSKLVSIKAPVLLFRGSEDTLITKEWMERIRDEIPKARLITFKNQSHHILLEIPEQIIKGIEKNYCFLEQK